MDIDSLNMIKRYLWSLSRTTIYLVEAAMNIIQNCLVITVGILTLLTIKCHVYITSTFHHNPPPLCCSGYIASLVLQVLLSWWDCAWLCIVGLLTRNNLLHFLHFLMWVWWAQSIHEAKALCRAFGLGCWGSDRWAWSVLIIWVQQTDIHTYKAD